MVLNDDYIYTKEYIDTLVNKISNHEELTDDETLIFNELVDRDYLTETGEHSGEYFAFTEALNFEDDD